MLEGASCESTTIGRLPVSEKAGQRSRWIRKMKTICLDYEETGKHPLEAARKMADILKAVVGRDLVG